MVLLQYWMLSKNGEMRRDDGCLDYSGGESVIVYPCHGQKGNQEWQYREVGQDQIKKKITLIRDNFNSQFTKD